MFDYKYTSTKEWVNAFPCAYRQWRADSHCNQNHGYAFTIKVYFSTNELDARNWVADYGSLRPLKSQLEEWFDHTQLVALDDPNKAVYDAMGEAKIAKIVYVEKTGCEGISEFIYQYINEIFIPTQWGTGEAERIWCTRVEVRETESNMAYYQGDRPTEGNA